MMYKKVIRCSFSRNRLCAGFVLAASLFWLPLSAQNYGKLSTRMLRTIIKEKKLLTQFKITEAQSKKIKAKLKTIERNRIRQAAEAKIVTLDLNEEMAKTKPDKKNVLKLLHRIQSYKNLDAEAEILFLLEAREILSNEQLKKIEAYYRGRKRLIHKRLKNRFSQDSRKKNRKGKNNNARKKHSSASKK